MSDITERATAARDARRNATGQVARRPDTRATVQSMAGEYQKALPKGVEATRFIRDAMTLLSSTPRLEEVDQMSFVGALMTCAQLGLRPGVGALGEAYVIPFKGKAQFILGYQGMTALAYRSGLLTSVQAHAVHENDTFEIRYGSDDHLIHVPAVRGPRGEAYGYYAMVKVQGGGYVFEYMSIEDMRDHMERFALARNRQGQIVGPWRDDFDAMARKTMVRKLWPYMPRSTEMTTAAAVDGSVRVDATPDAPPEEVSTPADEYVDEATDAPDEMGDQA